MNIDKLKFEKLGEKKRKILLTALNFNLNKLRCKYCKEKVDYKTCGIMPPLRKGTLGIITCNSPLCISEYLDEYQEFKPSESKEIKRRYQ